MNARALEMAGELRNGELMLVLRKVKLGVSDGKVEARNRQSPTILYSKGRYVDIHEERGSLFWEPGRNTTSGSTAHNGRAGGDVATGCA